MDDALLWGGVIFLRLKQRDLGHRGVGVRAAELRRLAGRWTPPSCTSPLAPAAHSESPVRTAGQEPAGGGRGAPEGILMLSHERAFGHFKKKQDELIFQLGDQGSVRTSCPRGSQLRYRTPVIKALCYFPPGWKQKLP